MLLQRGLSKTFGTYKKLTLRERREHYGNIHSLGNIVNEGKGEGKEGEEIDSDGLL
jgi:hypothetical protein